MPDGTQLGRGGAHGALLKPPDAISFPRLRAAPPAVWPLPAGDFAPFLVAHVRQVARAR
jgi:hypothetical protein